MLSRAVVRRIGKVSVLAALASEQGLLPSVRAFIDHLAAEIAKPMVI
jgi:hypothetical protein